MIYSLMFVVIGGNTDLKFTSPCQVKAREEGVMPVEYQYSGRLSDRNTCLSCDQRAGINETAEDNMYQSG